MLRQAGCLGIFIDESAPNVLILMFADDVSMCADTIGRLKEMILVLEQFCDKWGMKVNLNKTKVMVFRRGGSTRREEVFYFKGQKLEINSSYKYLGIIFTPKLKWTLATSTLVQQASKALASLNGCFKRCDGLPFDMAVELFDQMIAPILFYGSEIWVLSHFAESHFADSHFAESHFAESHLADSHFAESHLAESHLADSHLAESHFAESHFADSHFADSHFADSHFAESHFAEFSKSTYHVTSDIKCQISNIHM